jgi:hypothetical protein
MRKVGTGKDKCFFSHYFSFTVCLEKFYWNLLHHKEVPSASNIIWRFRRLYVSFQVTYSIIYISSDRFVIVSEPNPQSKHCVFEKYISIRVTKFGFRTLYRTANIRNSGDRPQSCKDNVKYALRLITEVPCHEDVWVRGGLITSIFSLGTRFRWAMSFRPQPPYLQGNSPFNPIRWVYRWTQAQKKKCPCPCWKANPGPSAVQVRIRIATRFSSSSLRPQRFWVTPSGKSRMRGYIHPLPHTPPWHRDNFNFTLPLWES